MCNGVGRSGRGERGRTLGAACFAVGLVVVACTGSAGPTGANGATGATGAAGATGASGSGAGTASFSLIEPRLGLLQREIDVALSAEGTGFTTPPSIDFGDASITVSNIQVVSATTLYAHLSIASNASLGPHDVTIGTTPPLKGTGAFDVEPDIATTLVAGTAQQGSFVVVAIHDSDTANFFDPTATGFAISGPGLASSFVSTPTYSDVDTVLYVAPATAPGPAQITVTNDPSAAIAFVSDPAALLITSATPTVTPLPYSALSQVASAGRTTFLDVTTTAGASILNYTVDCAASSSMIPNGIVLGASGQAVDVLARIAPPKSGSGVGFGFGSPPFHITNSIPITSGALETTLSLADLSLNGGGGITYDLHISQTPALLVAEQTSAHATTATAQELTTLPAIVTGTLSQTGEVDAYALTVPANAVVEFSLDGVVQADAGFPADQTGLMFRSSANAADVFVVGSGRPLVSTAELTQSATPATTRMYFVVTADPSATATTGVYFVSLRILP